jgi:hypothetical protein
MPVTVMVLHGLILLPFTSRTSHCMSPHENPPSLRLALFPHFLRCSLNKGFPQVDNNECLHERGAGNQDRKSFPPKPMFRSQHYHAPCNHQILWAPNQSHSGGRGPDREYLHCEDQTEDDPMLPRNFDSHGRAIVAPLARKWCGTNSLCRTTGLLSFLSQHLSNFVCLRVL